MDTDAIDNLNNVRWKRVRRMMLEENPQVVLDIGCSSGGISKFLTEKGVRVFGIDICPEKAKEACQKGLLATQHDISNGLPYENCFFDVVFAGEIIEHIIDTDFFLDEIHRVLKKDGKLVITAPNLVNFTNRLRVFAGRYPIFVDYTNRGDNHTRVYTWRALMRQLRERSFKIEVHTGSFVPLIPYTYFKNVTLRCMPVLGWLGLLFPGFAMHTIIKAKKVKKD